MNVALQRHTIEKKLRNRGINPDTVDLDSLIDSRLRLPENLRNLEKNLGMSLDEQSRGFRSQKRKAEKRAREIGKKTLKAQAEMAHDRRPGFNQLIDESKRNQRKLKLNRDNYRKWRRNPDKYDLKGIDTLKDKAARTDARIPANRANKLKEMAKKVDSSKTVRYDFVTPTEKKVIAQDFDAMRKSKLKSEPPKTRASELLEGDWRGAVAKQIDQKDNSGTGKFDLDYSGSTKTLDNKKKQVVDSGKKVRNLY